MTYSCEHVGDILCYEAEMGVGWSPTHSALVCRAVHSLPCGTCTHFGVTHLLFQLVPCHSDALWHMLLYRVPKHCIMRMSRMHDLRAA